MFNPIPNHVQQGLARLVTQYKNSPNLQGLLTGIITPIQDIEDALTGMNTLRYLPQAVGVQLDVIGIIVGINRPAGMSDADYLLEIYGQIKINTSQGQPEQVIQTLRLFTGADQVLLFEVHNAGIILESPYLPPDQATVDKLIKTLQKATAAGVRIESIVAYDPDNAFAYDGNLPGGGYDDGSGMVGGKYAQAFEYIGGGFAYAGSDPTGLGYGSEDDPLVGGTYVG